MKNRNRLTERIQFGAENNPLTHQVLVKAGVLVTAFIFLLQGSVVVSAGAASGTSKRENPGGLLQQVELEVVGGSKSARLAKLTPRSLLRGHIFDVGRLKSDLSLGAGGLTGAAGTFTLNQEFIVRRALPRNKRPIDTALPLGAFDGVSLKITNGSRDNQFTGNDRTWNYAGVTWDIYEERTFLQAGQKNPVKAVLYDEDTTVAIAGANTEFSLDSKQFPAGRDYISLLIMAEASAALADTVVNRAAFFSGDAEVYNKYSNAIKQQAADMLSEVASTSLTGLYPIDLASSAGDARDTSLAGAVGGLKGIIDVSDPGTSQLIINHRSIVPFNG